MNEHVTKLPTRETLGKGSVVTLKSGGPCMTVIDRTADNAQCTWHKDDSEIVSVWVPILALKVKE